MPTVGLTFLAPTAGIIAAAVAAPILLLLYFLKLKRRPVRVSTTLFWEQAAADLQVNAPFRWLRLSWLLFVQLALLTLLCLALARPALELEGPPPDRLAIVIDRSASASAMDGAPGPDGAPRSRLAESRDRALELIDRMPASARAMVVAFAGRPEILTSLTGDRALLRRAVESITPTDEEGDLWSALSVVAPSLAGASDELASDRPRVVLFSDGAAPPPAPDARRPAGLADLSFDFVRAGPPPNAPRDNVGIVALAARRDYEDPAVVRLFVRVQSTVAERIDVGLSCSLNGEPIATTVLSVPPATAGMTDVAHTFDFSAPEGGLAIVALTRSDALARDNTAAIVLKRPRPPRILLVQPNTPSDLVDYLPADALSALQPAELRVMTLGQYEALPAPQRLAYSLIVFDRSRPSELPAVPTISFGAGLPIAGLGVTACAPDDPAGRPTTFAFWQRSHPVMRYVAPAGVAVAEPLRLTLPGDEDRDVTLRVETLASGAAGPLIALLERAELRRLIVAFELGASRWWQDASFPVFLKNAVDFLTLSGDEYAGRVHRPGEAVSVHPRAGVERLEVTGPVSLTRSAPRSDGRATLGGLPLAGVYTVQGATPDDAIIAVSTLSPSESAIATRDELIIGGQSVLARGLGAAAPREIWRWLVLAALVLLSIEWMLYAWRMRV